MADAVGADFRGVETADPPVRPHLSTRVLGWLPGVLVTGFIVVGLLLVHTPAWDIVRYGLYLVLGVLLPGLLLHHALLGRRPMLLVDWSMGAATGIVVGMLAWAVYMALGIQAYLWTWPVLVTATFAAVPRLRRHWRMSDYPERSALTSWLMAGALTYFSAVTISAERLLPLPPHANAYYIDVYWHLANAVELTRRLPPEVPSVAGRTLRYHWFANANMAQAHLMTGVDLPTIILRLWQIPVAAVVLGLMLALSHQVLRRTWPAGLAAAIVVAPALLMPWGWFRTINPTAFVAGSPSEDFGLIATVLGAILLVDLIRRRFPTAAWPFLGLVALVGVGSKPSVAPTLLAGLGAVIAIRLVRRESVRRLVGAAAILVAAILVLAPLVAQSAAASGVKLFGVLAFIDPWKAYAPSVDLPATGGLFLAGMMSSAGTLILALAIVTSLVLQVTWVLAGLAVKQRGRRVDEAVWLLGGAMVGAMLATLVVDHAGQSEIYFERTAVPLGAVLAAWGLEASLVRSRTHSSRSTTIRVAGLGVGLGLAAYLLLELLFTGRVPGVANYPLAVLAPIVVAVLLAALGAAAWWAARRRWGSALVGNGALLACSALLAAFLVQGSTEGVRSTWQRVAHRPPATPATAVTAAETEAALWLKHNTPPDSVLATNVHCRFLQPMRFCDSRAYWITSLSERRALVESWAYTEENLNQIGTFNMGFPLFPFDEPDLLALNDRVFTHPTAADLRTLRERYGVTYLYADRRAGGISPELAQLATLRLSTGSAQIYELRP